MKTLTHILILSGFIFIACSKDNENAFHYPKEIIAVTELKDFRAFVAGVEISTDGLEPENIFTKELLNKNKYYLKFLSDTTLDFALSVNPTYHCSYNFKADSLYLFSNELFEEGYWFAGKGNKSLLAKDCAAYRANLYKKKNGQKVDVNGDEIIDIKDKLKVLNSNDQFLIAQDVLNKFGYSSLSEMEANDTVIIYNYKLYYKTDKNGDRMITSADN
jgi:hypothetical protein